MVEQPSSASPPSNTSNTELQLLTKAKRAPLLGAASVELAKKYEGAAIKEGGIKTEWLEADGTRFAARPSVLFEKVF